MAASIAALTAGGGGLQSSSDSTGNLDLKSGTTTIVALTSTGASVTGDLSATGITTVAAGTAALPAVVSATGTADTGLWFPAADTVAASTGGTERLRIDSSGNVGIGTSSPSTYGKLTVNDTAAKSVYIRSSSTNYSGLLLENTNSATKWQIGVEGGTYNTAGVLNIGIDSVGPAIIIDSSRNVLVGTTSTLGGKLSVKTSGATNAYLTNDTAGGYNLECDSESNGGTYYFVNFRKLGTGISNISSNGTTIAYNTGSDYRLKENIQPITNALDKVAQLKPCKWDWQQFWGEGSSQGFVAHELQEVVPDCVTGEKDATREEEYEVTPAVPAVVDAEGVETTPAVQAVKGTRTVPSYQGVDTSFLVATLTAAIQELKAIIDTQAAQIAALNAKVGI